jgi:hypothetical protein
MGRRANHRGYVLLLTLLMLTVAGTALTGLSLKCLRRALKAAEMRDELQRRWGIISCERVLLPQSESILHQSTSNAQSVKKEWVLGNQSFELIFADEQANVNVNSVFPSAGLDGTERIVRRLVGTAKIQIELSPLTDVPADRAFTSLAQLFGRTAPSDLFAADSDEVPTNTGVTCWGNGKLNIRRASRDALAIVGSPELDDSRIGRITEMRATENNFDIYQMLDHLDLDDRQKQVLAERLTDHSACHSLRVIATDGRRRWYALAVAEDQPKPLEKVWTFQW